jgi:hypothetical protein
MASILKLSGQTTPSGTTVTVDFIGGTEYRVSSWSPAVARRRTGNIGGRGPYAEVDEEMTITITGASALTRLEQVRLLLDQGERWNRGEAVYPVFLHYQPTASSSELKALVLGGEVGLPSNFINAPVVTVIDPVELRFRRSGLWYGAETAVTDATTINPETAVVSGFTALNAAAPIRVELEGLEVDKAAVNGSWVLVSSADTAARAEDRLVVVSAESFAPVLDYTSVNDSAKYARGNNVLRFSPSTADQVVETLAPTLSGLVDTNVRRWGVFINYRNNSATTSFRVRAALWHDYSAGGTTFVLTPWLSIPAGTSNPQWAFVGSAAIPDSLSRVTLLMEASAASGTLDVDDVVLMAMDFPDSDCALTVSGAYGGISLATELVIDPAPLTRATPAVYVYENSASQYLTYRGDAYLSMREGCTAVAVLWLTDGYSSATYWRAIDGGGAAQNPTVRVTRTAAYLTPR